jgi:short-subunit dehydrogenase
MKPAELFSLKGQTAVIIGGTGELCGAIAEGFAAAGAHVVLVGRDTTKAEARLSKIKANGGSGEFTLCEATNKSALIALRDTLLSRGPIDILINGAGKNSPTPFLEIAESEIDYILNVNVKSVILGCQVFGEAMVKAGRGSIINLGSESALTPLSRVFTYSASKAAVHNLSKNLATVKCFPRIVSLASWPKLLWGASEKPMNLSGLPSFWPHRQAALPRALKSWWMAASLHNLSNDGFL